MNWSDVEYIEGAYSFSGIHEKKVFLLLKDSRKRAQKSISNKVYFCGEAYHPNTYSCLPGALETAEVVVHNILFEN